ncbi:MAG: hypothetical protein AAB488_02765 [Patescibacteria group bacterium]
MSKLIIDDILAPKKPRRFPVSSTGSVTRGGLHEGESRFRESIRISYSLKRRHKIFLLIGLAFIFLLFVLSLFFAGATITIYPKQKTVFLNKTFLAGKSSSMSLNFETIEMSSTEEMESQATGLKEVKKKASGAIIVYNSYSSKAQKLIKNTRFETNDGKIYRIDDSIIVPGTKMVDGKIMPGSVETIVYANEPGEEYNIGRTDFTIPGFKGDLKYQKFYARSKTDMEGGMIGSTYNVSDEDAETAQELLKKRLSETLLSDALKNTPPGFILYNNGAFFDFDDIKILGKEGEKKVTIEETGKIYALIFNRDALAKYIAQTSIQDFDDSAVTSPTLDMLTFSIKDKELIDYLNISDILVTLSGTTTIVWLSDQEALLSDLLGKSKKSFQSILANYTGIDKAELIITPFWARSLPDNPERITFKTVVK